jgi:hypothetical protein
MTDVVIKGVAVISDANGNLTIVEAEAIPLPEGQLPVDSKVIEEARKKQRDSNSSDAA